MTFVNDNEIEVIAWIFPKVWCVVGTRHKGLEDGEEDAAVGRNFTLLANFIWFDSHERIFGESAEGVVGLVGENVSIGQKQDAGSAGGVAL